MRQIVKLIYGSHLYGLDTPSSDRDYKGVFIPPIKEVLMYGPPKTIRENSNNSGERNSSEDVDFENMSIQFFLKLACQGQTIAIDMLHAPREFIVQSTPEWEWLRANRMSFYSSNMDAFLGYCRHQAAKYGVKGGRINTIQGFIRLLADFDPLKRMSEYWHLLPEPEHSRKFISASKRDCGAAVQCIEICGRVFQSTATVGYTLHNLNKIEENYGKRARDARSNENIDWKAISHAFRVGLELREIYETGDLKFPLRDRLFLKRVKMGELHYGNDRIAEQLESLIEDVKRLAAKSKYPESVNLKVWEAFVAKCYEA